MVAALRPPTPATDVNKHADELETARLRLRMFAPEDLDAFHRLTRDPDVMRYIGDGVVMPRAQIEKNLSTIVAAFRRRGYGRWAVEEKATGRLAGYGGFTHGGADVGVELVYLLGKEFWGRGYATELGRACLRYAFEELGLDSVVGVTVPANHNSRRVLERVGMRFVRAGLYHSYPCVYYEIDRAAWRRDDSFYFVRRAPHRQK